MKIQQIPALFLPKRSPDAKSSLVNSPSKKKKSNKGRIDEQKKNDAKKCAYILRTNQETKVNERIGRIRQINA
jgi:hypothetical protein